MTPFLRVTGVCIWHHLRVSMPHILVRLQWKRKIFELRGVVGVPLVNESVGLGRRTKGRAEPREKM
jgi:hypothetical protein